MQEFLAQVEEYLEANVIPLEKEDNTQPDNNSIEFFIKAGKIGYITKLSETGKLDGYDTISTGKGDLGGKSYGSHQLRSTKPSTLTEFLKWSGYIKKFESVEYVSKEFDVIWKDLAKTDSKFNELQDRFIYDTHFKPFVSLLKKVGIDVEHRSIFVKELVYSTANQYGAGGIGASLCERISKECNNKQTDEEFIRKFTKVKIDSIPVFFKTSISKGTKPSAFSNRFNREMNILLNYMKTV